MNFKTNSNNELRDVPDFELALAFQSGNKDAFSEIDRRFRSRLFRFLRARVESQETAEDLTQETLLRAFSSLNTLRNGVFLSGWLKQIAYRVYVDWVRRTSKEPTATPYDESSSGNEDSVNNALSLVYTRNPKRPSGADFYGIDSGKTVVLRDERRNVWRIAREILTPTEFQTLWLRYEDELNDREIAKALGKSPGSVRVALSRAKKRLSKQLNRRDDS